uniref:Uncharacterized protein n=1 Tax=Knipowitschia caucasica TaxID=637954 RepID=A0AAV2JXP9_KNICA
MRVGRPEEEQNPTTVFVWAGSRPKRRLKKRKEVQTRDLSSNPQVLLRPETQQVVTSDNVESNHFQQFTIEIVTSCVGNYTRQYVSLNVFLGFVLGSVKRFSSFAAVRFLAVHLKDSDLASPRFFAWRCRLDDPKGDIDAAVEFS